MTTSLLDGYNVGGMGQMVAVTAYPPSVYNHSGASALPYSYLKHRPAGMTVSLVTFPPAKDRNTDDLRRQYEDIGITDVTFLGHYGPPVKSRIVRKAWAYYYRRRLPRAQRTDLGRFCASYPVYRRVVKAIERKQPDLVYVYPDVLVNWGSVLARSFPTIMTGPDCLALYYLRRLQQDCAAATNAEQDATRFLEAARLAKAWASTPAAMHFVGKEDEAFYNKLTASFPGPQQQSFFSPHPICGCAGSYTGTPFERPSQINVLIAQEDPRYTTDLTNLLVEAIGKSDADVKDRIKLHFRGSGATDRVEKANSLGLKAVSIGWVDCFEEFLAGMDVQVFPIAVGTGTKGKVLSAFDCGSLCIGTKHAFENIAIEAGTDCLEFETAETAAAHLAGAVHHPGDAKNIAIRGMKSVRCSHSPESSSTDFWGNAVKVARSLREANS